MTQEGVIVRVNLLLVLILPEVLDEIDRPRVALEAWHHELVRYDFLREW